MKTAIMDGEIHIPHGAITTNARRRIMDRLTFPNPAYGGAIARARMHGQEPNLKMIPEKLRFFRDDGLRLSVPRGAISIVNGEASRLNIENRTALARFPFRFQGRLRDYQADALRRMIRTCPQTIGCMPCGAGKTWLGCALIAKRGQVAAVLVNSHDLAEQWKENIAAALGIEAGGLRDDRAVCVGTIQAAAKAEGMGRFGTVLFDEVHHLPAATFFGTLPKFPALYRHGLTATPLRDDGLSEPIVLGIGPIAANVGHARLIRDGWLMAPEVRWIRTGWKCRTKSFTAALNHLAADEGRMAAVTGIARRMADEGRQTLIVSGRKPHLRSMARELADSGTPAALLLGDQARGVRRQVLRRARRGDSGTILSTAGIAAEGLDLPGLEALIVGSFSKARNRAVQTMGRLMRPREGKRRPILWDLVDGGKMPDDHAEARRRAYRGALGSAYKETGWKK